MSDNKQESQMVTDLKTPRGYEDFDTEWYLEDHYSTLQNNTEGDYFRFFLDAFFDIFNSGTIKGDRLLDIGTGPSVFSVISASRHVNEIHISDWAPQNRAVLQNWLEGETNTPTAFEYVVSKENLGSTAKMREDQVREKVKKVLKVDVLQSEPLKNNFGEYDIITTSQCFEAACKTIEMYYDVIAQTADMLKPGGCIVAVGTLRTTFYRVGDFKFGYLSVHGDQVKDSYRKAGLHVEFWRESKTYGNYKHRRRNNCQQSDFDGMFAVVARKEMPQKLKRQ